MGFLLPIIIAVIGLGIGIGAGLVLRPDAPPPPVEKASAEGESETAKDSEDAGKDEKSSGEDKDDEADENTDFDYVKLNNQFIIPVVAEGRVTALVVVTLSLEVPAGQTAAVYEREPKLRDAFLQVMFDHANAGGFDGAFTSSGKLNNLRNALREAADKYTNSLVSDVLITDVVKQDTE